MRYGVADPTPFSGLRIFCAYFCAYFAYFSHIFGLAPSEYFTLLKQLKISKHRFDSIFSDCHFCHYWDEVDAIGHLYQLWRTMADFEPLRSPRKKDVRQRNKFTRAYVPWSVCFSAILGLIMAGAFTSRFCLFVQILPPRSLSFNQCCRYGRLDEVRLLHKPNLPLPFSKVNHQFGGGNLASCSWLT